MNMKQFTTLLIALLLLPLSATLSAQESELSLKSNPSRGGAMLRSLVFPGWGESYAQQPERGKWFSRAEVVMLIGLGSYTLYGQWREYQYRNWAMEHAGVWSDDHERGYWVSLGVYDSSGEYNESMSRSNNFDARYLDPQDSWEWDSESDRLRFRRLRIQADDAGRMAWIIGGGVLVNHLFSAIHAARLVPNERMDVSVDPFNRNKRITVRWNF